MTTTKKTTNVIDTIHLLAEYVRNLSLDGGSVSVVVNGCAWDAVRQFLGLDRASKFTSGQPGAMRLYTSAGPVDVYAAELHRVVEWTPAAPKPSNLAEAMKPAKPHEGERVTAEMLAEMSKPGMIFNNDAIRGASAEPLRDTGDDVWATKLPYSAQIDGPPKPLRVVSISEVSISEGSADYDLAVLELSDGRNAALDGRLARACGLRSRHDAALADEMGAMRTENTGLLADNARLRRKLEDAERKLAAATRKKGPWER